VILPGQAMADIAGKTILAKGDVKATNNTTAEVRKLRRRAKIFSVDHIVTGTKSKAQFSMSDGGLITLKENTEIKISEYSFDDKSKKGSATLEVVSGGLRSISGLIKKSGGDYQVKTPVGSIGIRGTHFAVEVVGDNVVFGVFSGDIDVQLHNQQVLSLGANEDFSFASVSPGGQVTLLTQAPPVIAAGLVNYQSSAESSEENNTNTSSQSDSNTSNENDSSSSNQNVSSTGSENSSSETSTAVVLDSQIQSNDSVITSDTNVESNSDIALDASLYNESDWQGVDASPIAELIAERKGTLTYNNIADSSIGSSTGEVRDFTMTMTIDFDNGSVPEGSISFSDQQGAWFAAYSGLINIDQLDLGINFASHGDNRADGNISAAFSNGLDEITGAFNLFELENQQINAGGSFKIKR
jgi:hypothetical protein